MGVGDGGSSAAVLSGEDKPALGLGSGEVGLIDESR